VVDDVEMKGGVGNPGGFEEAEVQVQDPEGTRSENGSGVDGRAYGVAA
jgi:hypothetical protein